MIKNPHNGWAVFQMGNFVGTPSYLTDVPVDLLDAFIDFHCKGSGVAWFDEEGCEFMIVLSPYSVYIIEDKNSAVLHDFSAMDIGKLERELIADIERELEDWVSFLPSEGKEEENGHRKKIEERLELLKKHVK